MFFCAIGARLDHRRRRQRAAQRSLAGRRGRRRSSIILGGLPGGRGRRWAVGSGMPSAAAMPRNSAPCSPTSPSSMRKPSESSCTTASAAVSGSIPIASRPKRKLRQDRLDLHGLAASELGASSPVARRAESLETGRCRKRATCTNRRLCGRQCSLAGRCRAAGVGGHRRTTGGPRLLAGRRNRARGQRDRSGDQAADRRPC